MRDPLDSVDDPSAFVRDYYLNRVTQKPEDYELEGGVTSSKQARYSEMLPARPQTSESFLGRAGQSIGRGVVQGKEIAGGLTMMAGEAIGSDEIKSLGEGMAIESQRYATENAPRVRSYTDIDGVGDFFEYATSAILEMAPLNIALLATGVGGAGIAGKIATGAFRGAITREVAAGVTEEMITKFGIEGAKKEFAAVLAKDTASKAAQQTGAKIGVGAGSSIVETGLSAANINRETGETGGLTTALLGTASGATDMVGGQAKALTNVLSGTAADKATGAIKHIAKKTGEVIAAEVPQEIIQEALGQTALQAQTPDKNQFGPEFFGGLPDVALKTALGVSPLGVVSGLATLPPSKDPAIRTQEADIINRTASILNVDPSDVDAANAALSDDNQDADPIQQRLIIANDKLKTANAQLDSEILADVPNPEEVARLQEERKQAIEEIKSIENQEEGFSTETGTKGGRTYRRNKANPYPETGLPAPNEKAGSEWLDSQFQPEADPEKLSLNEKIRMTLKPYANMLNAHGVTFARIDADQAQRRNNSRVSWDDEGNITLHLNAQKAKTLTQDRFSKEVEEEAVHVAQIIADRIDWTATGRAIPFRQFARKQSRARATTIRRTASSRTIQSLGLAYLGKEEAFMPEGKSEQQIEDADVALDREFNRAVIQKVRTGKITEDLKILEAAEAKGDVEAGSLLDLMLQSLKNLKEILINYISSKTAPKDLKAHLDQVNKILDKYSNRVSKKRKPVESSQSTGKPNTPPEDKNDAQGNVEPPQGQPEAESESVSAGEELFDSTEYGQYFETQDWNGSPTGTILIRAEVPKGKDPLSAIKATQKYRDLARKSKVFTQGAAFEIPKDSANAGTEITDASRQVAYIDSEAKAMGYSGMSELYKENPDQYETLATNWRIRHPRDNETGANTADERAELVDETLGSGGSLGSGNTLLDAASNLGRSERTSSTNERVQEDSRRLEDWARKNDRLITELPFVLDGKLDQGNTEQHAFFHEPSERWIKVTKWLSDGFGMVIGEGIRSWGARSATAREYVDRLIEQNKVFGDDIRLHGVYINKAGDPMIVTSQPHIKGRDATTEEISEAMRAAWFVNVGDNGYYRERDNLFIGDLHSGNAHMVDGTLVVFDGLPARPTGRFLDQILDDMASYRLDNPDSAQAGTEIPEYEREFTDGVVAYLRGLHNTLKAKPEKIKSKAGYYLEENHPGLATVSRPEKVLVESAMRYIANNGFLTSMQKAAANNLGGMDDDSRVFLNGILLKFAEPVVDMIQNESGMKPRAAADAINEILTLRAEIQQRFADRATQRGRSVQAHAILKRYVFDGISAENDLETGMFNAAQIIEPALAKSNLGEIYSHFRDTILKVAEDVLTKKEFLVKLGAVVNRAMRDPKALDKAIKSAIRKGKAGARAVNKAVARMGNEILSQESNIFLEELASKVAFQIDMTAPTGSKKTGKGFIEQALTKFAKDHFPKEKKAPVKVKDKNINILRAIIANDKLKDQFIEMLEGEVASQYKKGKNDPAFKRDYATAFDAMREEGWSEGIRNAALEETKKNLGMTIGKMLSSGAWQDNKEQVVKMILDHTKGFGTKEQISKLVDEVNAELDDQAAKHLTDTFGFTRNPDGTYQTTDKGQLKGGQGLRRAIRSIGSSLKDITKLSYGSQRGEADKLAKLATDRLGLPEELAMKVQQILSDEISQAADFTRDLELKKRIERVSNGLKNKDKIPETKSVIDKLVEMANQGFLDNRAVYESIRANYKGSKLPAFDPKIAEMVRKFGNEMDKLPEGIHKNEIRQTIANELANVEGISLLDSAKSYWYFSLLSGPSTSMVNAVYNMANLMANATVMSADRPAMAPKIWRSIFLELTNPNSASWAKFAYTMQTGLAPIEVSSKYGATILKKGNIIEVAQLPIERISKENAVTWYQKILYRLSRGLFQNTRFEISARSLSRFMAATDQLFRTTATQAALGWQGVTITQDMVDTAMRQADNEMPSASKAKKRTRADEIIKQKMAQNPDTQYAVERAEHIGMETAFTQDPKGMIGSLARFIGKSTEKYPPLLLLFPFTKIVANVWNETLNYTPMGAVRYGFAASDEKMGRGGEWTILDKNGKDVADSLQLKKAVLGTIVTALIAMMTFDDDDDIEIFGVGPKDKQKRIAFFERGSKPYTIRAGDVSLSYQYLGPFAAVLGILGAMMDVKRNDTGKNKSGFDKVTETLFTAAASVLTTQLSQSFLSSASNMVDALYSTSPGSGLQRWAAMQTSSVMPNVVRQINNDWVNRDVYKSSSFYGQVMAGMGVTKMLGTQPSLNYFGDKIRRREIPMIGRFVTLLGGDKVIEEIDSMGLRLPGFANVINGKPMNDEQIRMFREVAGPQLKQSFINIMPTVQRLIEAGKKEEAQNMLDDAASRINKQARQQMNSKP